jgi:superfamily II DNA or RNA helicase
MTIHYFNALAGAGKTYALAQYSDRLARSGEKVLFIQPTKHLIDKTIEDELLKLNPRYSYKAIHGDVDLETNSVVGDLVAHFQQTAPGGEILFATHAAFLRLPHIQNKSDWVLIVDEVPQVDVFEEKNLPDTHHLLTGDLVLVAAGSRYGQLVRRGDVQ